MVLQYTAIGIQNVVNECQTRADYQKNLEYVARSITLAVRTAKLDLPVRLVALSEGALGGWAQGRKDWAQGKGFLRAYEELLPEIPGAETDFLGELCKEGDFYLIGQMQAKDPELAEERIFNIAFIIDPDGKVIHKHHKTAFFSNEPLTAPSDIWDTYIQKYGADPVKLFEALYPVARTEIGNIGTLVCAEGSFPEAARGVALNGAEIIWRAEYVEPWKGNYMFEIQNRAHAIFNTCYVIQPQTSDVIRHMAGFPPEGHRVSYGTSQIIDYRGNIISQYLGTGESYVSAIINIDGLRDFRVRGLWQNLVKDLRIEEYKVIYDAMMAKGAIYPKNLHMEEPLTVDGQVEVLRYSVNRMVELGVYTPPPGWKPYTINKEILERIEKAGSSR